MTLSPNFKLAEFTRSATALKYGIDNTPGYAEIANMAYLVAHVLQPAREAFGKPIVISSGYRCPALNSRVGGVSDSRHLLGMAADIVCTSEADYRRLFSILKANAWVDLLLFEHKGKSRWLHVQVARCPRNKSNFNFFV